MARREIALKPFTLSSEKMAHVGFCCSAARAMPTAISAPPATPHPSWSGLLHLACATRSCSAAASPAAFAASADLPTPAAACLASFRRSSTARCSISGSGADSVSTSPILTERSRISTLPASRLIAEPMPIGRVPPSGFMRPTSSDSPCTAVADLHPSSSPTQLRPALMPRTMVNSVLL